MMRWISIIMFCWCSIVRVFVVGIVVDYLLLLHNKPTNTQSKWVLSSLTKRLCAWKQNFVLQPSCLFFEQFHIIYGDMTEINIHKTCKTKMHNTFCRNVFFRFGFFQPCTHTHTVKQLYTKARHQIKYQQI